MEPLLIVLLLLFSTVFTIYTLSAGLGPRKQLESQSDLDKINHHSASIKTLEKKLSGN